MPNSFARSRPRRRTDRCVRHLLLLVALLGSATGNAVADRPEALDTVSPPCHPQIDPGQRQHVVGYGSLMQRESRRQTAPGAGDGRPVRVGGVERGWYMRGSPTSPATFLGAVANPGSRINAVVYELPLQTELAATDRREAGYCRSALAPQQLHMLDGGERPQGQVWIYTVPEGKSSAPDADHPITQSYVDVFLSGCIELGDAHGLASFAEECVRTTRGWAHYWVNDRIFPRRPFVHQPRAGQIDALLRATVPDQVQSRVIE